MKTQTLISLLFSGFVMLISCDNKMKPTKIENEVWSFKNLNVDTFRNGDRIYEAKTYDEWVNYGKAEKPAWCYYNNNPENGDKSGKLYNWYAVNDSRGLAPKGWRIPSRDDFLKLESYISSNIETLDINMILGGYRVHTKSNFVKKGVAGLWWSSSKSDSDRSWRFDFKSKYLKSTKLKERLVFTAPNEYGASIICIKD